MRHTLSHSLVMWMAAAALAAGQARSVDFAKDVYPILRARCFSCHAGVSPASGLRLDHYAKLLGETDGVALVIRGKSESSTLIRIVSQGIDGKIMPPEDGGRPLKDAEVSVLKAWIDQGARWDTQLLPDPNRIAAAQHWAFQPINRPSVPALIEYARARNPNLLQPSGQLHPIDAFVARVHKLKGVKAARIATPSRRLRRLHQVMHGMSPIPSQVSMFIVDDQPAWRSAIENVLGAKAYGERMARMWLDSARWAESEGFAQNNERPFAWRYRDYVIGSFNRDLSYADFLTQQIAGDELQPYQDTNIVATGFLAAARISADDLHYYRAENDMYTDIVNTVSRSILGLTLGCSQCHDHKFDPLSQRDFYRFQAFFRRGFPGNIVLANSKNPKELKRVAGELLELDLKVRDRVLREGYDESGPAVRKLLHTSVLNRTIDQERRYRPERVRLNIRVAGCNAFRIKENEKKQLESLRKELQKLEPSAVQTWGFYSPVTSPFELATLPMAGNFPLLHDKERLTHRRDYLLSRGEVLQPVALVKAGWPAAFGPTESPRLSQRPRTALADWITNRDNPLTARVWVNRIWQMHFGRGLVDTPGNFGVKGGRPSHPELLDWLAAELVDHGWSTKHIHRLILTSRVWQQASYGKPDPRDPDNRLLTRWQRRRLTSEAIRDSMLAVSGLLDREVGGPSVRTQHQVVSGRRGLYLFRKRDAPPPLQALFDGPTALAEPCLERKTSTSALQALYLLNNAFSRRQGQAFARRIRKAAGDSIDAQIRMAFKLALGRQPDEVEFEQTRQFLANSAEAYPAQNDKQLVQKFSQSTGKDGLAIWLRADKLSPTAQPVRTGVGVPKWYDLTTSGHKEIFSQSGEQQRPRWLDGFDGIGGLPAVRFAGGPFGQSDHLLSAKDHQDHRPSTGYTFFAVVRFNGQGERNEPVFFKARNGGTDIGSIGIVRFKRDGRVAVAQNVNGQWGDRVFTNTPVPNGVPVLIAARWTGSRLKLDVLTRSGTLSSSEVEHQGTIDFGMGGRVSVGGYIDAFSDNGERLNGDIGELLFFTKAISDSRYLAATECLKRRWLARPTFGSSLQLLAQAMLNLNEFLYIE